jgi:hypothetical protein
MSARAAAEQILKELQFDFATFTMDGFLYAVSQMKGREIISIPWDMPSTLFGAWVSDGDEAREYIFYRNNVSEPHQIHIQLHELSHFLFGHPTLQINRKMIAEVVDGTSILPFTELPQLRSTKSVDVEVEAETLANLIQQRAIQNSKLDLLIHDTPMEEKLTHFLNKMGLL